MTSHQPYSYCMDVVAVIWALFRGTQYQEVACEFGDGSCPFDDCGWSHNLVLVSSPFPKPRWAAKCCHYPSLLLPSFSTWWRWEILAPFGIFLVSSDSSKYLPCSVKAEVWLMVSKQSCLLQSPDVFICLCFPLSRLFYNTHGIK